MGESGRIFYKTVENTFGEGAQKEEPKQEKPLVKGTSDPDMIERELQRASTASIEENPQSQHSIEKIDNNKIQPEIKENDFTKDKKTELEILVNNIDLPSSFGDFKTIEYIGSGGISDVFLVEQPSTGARFVYKRLNTEKIRIASNQNVEAPKLLLDVLRGGAKLIANLGERHPDKFPVFAIDHTNSDNPGILTQYIPHPLEERIGKLSEEEALKYILQASEEIRILHENGVVLADIKPSQFRIDNGGNLRLVDLDSKHSDPKSIVSTLVQSIAFSQVGRKSGVLGTPRYMAPEQWELLEGKPAVIDESTDVYGLASMAYELITGDKPEGSHIPIEGKLAKLEGVILKARQRKQRDRHQNLIEFLRDINDSLGYEKESISVFLNSQSSIDLISITSNESPVEKLEELADSPAITRGINEDRLEYWGRRGEETSKILQSFYNTNLKKFSRKKFSINIVDHLGPFSRKVEFNEDGLNLGHFAIKDAESRFDPDKQNLKIVLNTSGLYPVLGRSAYNYQIHELEGYFLSGKRPKLPSPPFFKTRRNLDRYNSELAKFNRENARIKEMIDEANAINGLSKTYRYLARDEESIKTLEAIDESLRSIPSQLLRKLENSEFTTI